ncbi:MAG TPA: hypothetical protein VMK05_04910, partial [Burkholderiales bacterium]|nr:hypothetical protein [Burkholderiales bacterium]
SGPNLAHPAMRELEQAVRRTLLTHHYAGNTKLPGTEPAHALAADIDAGALTARDLLSRYCGMLYDRLGTIEEVARRTGLDRRTAKKYVTAMHADGAPRQDGVTGRPDASRWKGTRSIRTPSAHKPGRRAGVA